MSRIPTLALAALLFASCQKDHGTAERIDLASASDFIANAEQRIRDNNEYHSRVDWVKSNFITYDTNWLAARASATTTKLSIDLASGARRFAGLDLPEDMDRKMTKLQLSLTIPAPPGQAAADELAELRGRLETTYSTGRGMYRSQSRPLVELEDRMRTVRNARDLEEMWTSWHEVSPPMKADYARMVEIANEGALELGFSDVGDMWRAKYDMDPDTFATMTDTLWAQVKPLYDELHCYVRAKLGEYYGTDLVKPGDPIPAHLLGNMWAQEWGNIFPIVAPATVDPGYDLTALMQKNSYDAERMARVADDFFVSLGFEPMPETFWQRSLFTKPQDREVVCHASAWDLDDENDIRIKMCTKVNADDFVTMHHEIGHNIYQRAYNRQSIIYRDGANDGFHEAVGDMIALSITPDYLKRLGLLNRVPDESKDLGILFRSALDKIAFLPFGLLIDKWRWQVFSGELTPETYNSGWWALREQYQGVKAPVERAATHFDPGAKYHVPNNTPYMRYFLARILQFQFHRSACEIAGWDGPLHRCSIFGNKEVGDRFKAMLQMGSSRPWPEALEAFTGSPTIDATAIIDYYAPVMEWLGKQNAGRQCGW